MVVSSRRVGYDIAAFDVIVALLNHENYVASFSVLVRDEILGGKLL